MREKSSHEGGGQVLGAVGVMGAYWWYVLVPNARVNLAVNKRKGDLRVYLEQLKQDDSRPVERWFYRCVVGCGREASWQLSLTHRLTAQHTAPVAAHTFIHSGGVCELSRGRKYTTHMYGMCSHSHASRHTQQLKV